MSKDVEVGEQIGSKNQNHFVESDHKFCASSPSIARVSSPGFHAVIFFSRVSFASRAADYAKEGLLVVYTSFGFFISSGRKAFLPRFH